MRSKKISLSQLLVDYCPKETAYRNQRECMDRLGDVSRGRGLTVDDWIAYWDCLDEIEECYGAAMTVTMIFEGTPCCSHDGTGYEYYIRGIVLFPEVLPHVEKEMKEAVSANS